MFKWLCLASCATAFFACGIDCKTVLEEFADPPKGFEVQAWNHWVSDFVSEKGLAADYAAMGQMGVGVAHIFAPRMAFLPPSPKPMSPEWLALFAKACTEAKKNGLLLGAHNCPGWSSSGGPWIKPEDSMKFVVHTTTDCSSADKEILLPKPIAIRGFYRDIAVLALPIARQPKTQTQFPLRIPTAATGSVFEKTFSLDTPVAAKWLSLSFAQDNIYVAGEVLASADEAQWTNVGKFSFSLYRSQRTPKIIRIKPLAGSRFFKIIFRHVHRPPWGGDGKLDLTAATFSDIEMVENVDNKNSASTKYGYVPGDASQKGINLDATLDLTGKLDSAGRLDWRPSSGDWRILRIGYTTTGKTCAPATLSGLECDKLSRRGLDAHWPNYMGKLLAVPEAKDVLRYAIIDSWEVGGQNWTEELPDKFARRKGYPLRKWLPAICGYVINDGLTTAKFLWDFQETVGELLAENYYDYFAELCRKNGLESITEPYGGPFDGLRCGKNSSVPTGEFWIGRDADNHRVASIAHLYGQRQTAAEAFTTEEKEGRWQITPRQLVEKGEEGFLGGVNQLVVHSYCHQPFLNAKPGISLGRHGTQWNRHTTWWNEGKSWSEWVRRAQFLLQSGKPKSDLLYFVLFQNTGNQKALSAVGWSYDFCCADAFLKLEVRDGGVAMPGQEPYSVLSLGAWRNPSLAQLRKLKELVAKGAKVAALKPIESPSLVDDKTEYDALVAELWNGKNILEESDPAKALKKFGMVPVCKFPNVVRKFADGMLCFMRPNQAIKEKVSFRIPQGLAPAILNPIDGSVEHNVAWERDGEFVKIFLDLRAKESAYILFVPSTAQKETLAEKAASPEQVAVIQASAPWQVSFDGKNVPETCRMKSLAPWNESPDEKLRYFSGAGIYSNTFVLAKNSRTKFRLRLKSNDVIHAWLNGHDLGCHWRFRDMAIDIPPEFIKDGANVLRIAVINTWQNRMIGDAIARKTVSEEKDGAWPKWVLEDREDSGNGIYTWSHFNGWKADDALARCGLEECVIEARSPKYPANAE